MINNFDFEKIGYYKYKSNNQLIAECIREYPITEFVLSKIKKNEIFWEIETLSEEKKPSLLKGKLVVLI